MSPALFLAVFLGGGALAGLSAFGLTLLLTGCGPRSGLAAVCAYVIAEFLFWAACVAGIFGGL